MQRLKTRPQFQAVLAGSIVARTEHFVLHRGRPAPFEALELQPKLDTAEDKKARQSLIGSALFPVPDVWIGAMVPKRWAKRAVTRNAIKRQIYIVCTDFMIHYPQAAFLVRLRREFLRKDFVSATSVQLKEAVRAEVMALMQAGPGPL